MPVQLGEHGDYVILQLLVKHKSGDCSLQLSVYKVTIYAGFHHLISTMESFKARFAINVFIQYKLLAVMWS